LLFFHTQHLNKLFFIFPFLCSAGKTAANQEGKSAWAAFWVIVIGLVLAASGGYLVYKYRIRVRLVALPSLVTLFDAFVFKFIKDLWHAM
jgi:hypothetical protein